MILTLTGKLSTHAGLQRVLCRDNVELEVKKALSRFFGAPIENITITIVERIITITILEISSINTNKYTLLISCNMIASMIETHKIHPSAGIYSIFLIAKIEESNIHMNGGSVVELARPVVELARPAVEFARPTVEPFILIREEHEIEREQRHNMSSLRIQIPNGSSVSFDICVNMVVYPHVAEPEDFQHTVSRCRINDEIIPKSPSKRQRTEEQEILILLPKADEITLEMLRRVSSDTDGISREIISFLEILRGGLVKFSSHPNPIQFMFSDFRVSFRLSTTLQCLQWTSVSYESYKRNIEFITDVNAFIASIVNQFIGSR